MDPTRFDTLIRIVHSRRTALGGLLGGGLAVLLGLPGIDDAAAHNPVAACDKLPTPSRRRQCRRRARAHARTCHPEPVARTCAGRCDTVRNRCGTRVDCRCPAGSVCMSNGSCALRRCEDCLDPCYCYYSVEGPWICFGDATCGEVWQDCRTTGTAGCPLGQVCMQTGCGDGMNAFPWRCVPLCRR